MKKILFPLFSLILLAGCTADDEYQLSDFVGNDTLTISYNGTSATMGTLPYFVSASTNGAHVTVNTYTSKHLIIQLSGTTTNGSLLFYGSKGFSIDLNNVHITNPNGPAINNQCGKALYVTMTDGTTNSLCDGTSYADAPISASGDTIQQKGAFFSEGQIYFRGKGELSVSGNARNGIASDDYITFESGTVNVSVASTGSNGVKANDGVFILGGTLNIDVAANGARGIKNDARMEIRGGTTTISTSGDCKIETVDGVTDTTSCAGIKCDSLFTMTAGTLIITSTGDGGKGINASEAFLFKGGTLQARATGSENNGKPKAVKSEVGITLSGGSFYAESRKSKATDNAGDETPTIIGTPKTQILTKKKVSVEY